MPRTDSGRSRRWPPASRQRPAPPPAPVRRAVQIAHQVGHEQRAALGPRVDEGRELRRERCPGIPAPDSVRRPRASSMSSASRDRCRACRSASTGPNGWLASTRSVGREVTMNRTAPRRTCREVGEQVDRRRVRPGQIVEEQDQRPGARQLAQQRRHLALQPFLRDRLRLNRQSVRPESGVTDAICPYHAGATAWICSTIRDPPALSQAVEGSRPLEDTPRPRRDAPSTDLGRRRYRASPAWSLRRKVLDQGCLAGPRFT